MYFQYINKLFAFTWLLIIGSNVAQYYSQEAAYQGAIILLGAIYFPLVYRQQTIRLFICKDFVFVLLMLILPVLLMLVADRNFLRGDYTSVIGIALVFMVATVLASRGDLAKTLSVAAFSIVLIGVAVNLYELLVENNVWSTSPGRSAGFYINPNISSEALVGFSLVFLLWRSGRLAVADFLIMFLAMIGVLSTFSRTGILAALSLFSFTILLRMELKHFLHIFTGAVLISLGTFVISSYVLENTDLSDDAMVRITSLLGKGGIGDYQEARGEAALFAMDMALKEPLLGVGVRTIYEMTEGPHNMFVAMMVDYGALGAAIYIFFILRVIFVAKGSKRDPSTILWLFCGWLIIFSFASHNLLGNTAIMPLFGFALARVYQIHVSKRSRQVIQ